MGSSSLALALCGLLAVCAVQMGDADTCGAASIVGPANTVGATGSSVTLQCTLLSPMITWVFVPNGGTSGIVIASSGACNRCQVVPGTDPRYTVDSSTGGCNLVIGSLTQAQAGTYTCQDSWGQVSRTATLGVTMVCPTGFVTLPGAVGCYQVLTTATDWTTARTRCAALAPGASTVAITSKAIDDALSTYISTFKTCSTGFWTCGRRRSDNCYLEFLWQPSAGVINDVYPYINWSSGEPNCNGPGNEPCLVRLASGNVWNDVSCSSSFCPICAIQ